MQTNELTSLILYCRAGFEGECAAEIQERAAEQGVAGYCRAQAGTAFVEFVAPEPGDAWRLAQGLPLAELVFARQMFAARRLEPMAQEDRVTPVRAALGDLRVGGLMVETADTNEAKELLVFARKFEKPLAASLRKGGLLHDDPKLPYMHLFLLDSANAYLGLADPANSSPWFMGIPRLRFPRGAPSRSALKLEEAFHLFLGDEREKHLRPGMCAVDLGAAPGGWTRLLVNHHVRVVAVDNGPMDAELMESGIVEHRREDGFRFRPVKPVDWMVCDMVAQPIRVAQLVADWVARGYCRETIFNLKLPMKKRYQEVKRCAELIHEELAAIPHELHFKQLYHDREEVTGHLLRLRD
jgi:23S rRNA (cytidine2498-2'-O)-methyltransferase